MIAQGEADLDSVRDRMAEKYTPEQLDEIAEMYMAAYRDSGMTVEEAWEEMVCDSLGEMNIFEGTLDVSAGQYAEVLQEVKTQTEATRKEGRGPPTESEDKYSVNESFENDLDLWDKEGRPDGDTFEVGSTGDVLQGLGAIESDIYILSKKINNIFEDHSEMTLNEIKKIPKILDDPVLILKSKNIGRDGKQNTRLVIFGSVKAENKQPVLSVLDLRPREKHFVMDDMQKVTSAYTKTINPVDFIKKSEVLYADKKRSSSLLRTIGFKMPIEHEQNSSFVRSITYKKQKVKIEGKNFSEVFKEQKLSREETSLTDLRKENTKLRAQVEYWRNQTKVTDHPTLREGDVKKAAGEILKEYKSTTDKTEIAKEMQRLGNYIVQSGENVQWDNIKERTHMPISSPPLFSLEFISPFIYTKTDGNKIVAVCLNITYITAKPTGTGKQEQ